MKLIIQRQFGKVAVPKEITDLGAKIKKFYDKNPTAYLTTITAGASTSNLAMNTSRKKQDKEYQENQISAMKDLTNALSGVDKTLKTKEIKVEEKKPSSRYNFRKYFSTKENSDSDMIKFRRKDFSVLSSTIEGAKIGAGVGTLSLPIKGKNLKISVPEKSNGTFKRIAGTYNDMSPFAKKISIVGVSTLLGAALGALAGIIVETDKAISRKTTVDNRLMSKVVDDLEKTGFKEGEDFTRDPKTADRIKSQVSIAITRNSGELRILVNTIADKKLKNLTNEIIKNIPNSSSVSEEAKNRYNEISITSISDGSADVGLISGICEKFIRNKYPVYLVEVG